MSDSDIQSYFYFTAGALGSSSSSAVEKENFNKSVFVVEVLELSLKYFCLDVGLFMLFGVSSFFFVFFEFVARHETFLADGSF